MRVLLVKTSSLGDVLHTLPAVTEAAGAHSGLTFDWVVEPDFAAIPRWHPAVAQVIEAPLRRFRRQPPSLALRGLAALDRRLRKERYDAVIDAQGLLKSAALVIRARGPSIGFNAASVRERLASVCYTHRIAVARDLHAVERTRRLFAAALGHACVGEGMSHGLEAHLGARRAKAAMGNEVFLLHGTTWRSKHWPEAHWCALASRLAADGFVVRATFANEVERGRGERIAEAGRGELVPHTDLDTLCTELARARGLVGVDTGLLHLAAAIGVPGVALYGPTDPVRTRPWSNALTVRRSDLACAPCLARRCALPDGAYGCAPALAPPCLGRIEPAEVHALLLARMTAERA